MSQIGNPSIDALLSQTVMTICFGEMLQLTSQRRYDQSLDEYYAKIERKTAVLLAASTYCGAVLGGLDEAQVEAMRRFGRLLGMSFQIADDVLDYLATEEEVGKPVGNDLKQGTVTLPLMLARHDPGVDGRLEAILEKATLQDACRVASLSALAVSRRLRSAHVLRRGTPQLTLHGSELQEQRQSLPSAIPSLLVNRVIARGGFAHALDQKTG